jgi:cobalt-precorrin 5A hydrolase
LSNAVTAALNDADVPVDMVDVVATLDRRAESASFRSLAASFGWELRGFPAAELAALVVPSPSELISGLVGTPAVAEAAALLAAGPGSVLIARKRVLGPVTVAIACHFQN